MYLVMYRIIATGAGVGIVGGESVKLVGVDTTPHRKPDASFQRRWLWAGFYKPPTPPFLWIVHDSQLFYPPVIIRQEISYIHPYRADELFHNYHPLYTPYIIRRPQKISPRCLLNPRNYDIRFPRFRERTEPLLRLSVGAKHPRSPRIQTNSRLPTRPI